MSRGPGKAQTELLRIIDQGDDRLDTFRLATMLYHPRATGDVVLSMAEIKATHRALRGLLKDGKIEDFGCNSLGRMQWAKLGSRDRLIEKVTAGGTDADKWLRWKLTKNRPAA